jgi:hypothetical protein
MFYSILQNPLIANDHNDLLLFFSKHALTDMLSTNQTDSGNSNPFMSTQRVKQDESPPSAGPVVSHDDGDDQDDNSVYFDADEASNVDIDELAESMYIDCFMSKPTV